MSSEIRENFLTRVSSTLRRFRTSDKFATTLKDCFLVIPRHRRARRNDFVSARREQRRPRLACGPAHKPHLSRANVQITGRHAGFWHFSTERQNACSKFVLSTRHCGNPSSSPRIRGTYAALSRARIGHGTFAAAPQTDSFGAGRTDISDCPSPGIWLRQRFFNFFKIFVLDGPTTLRRRPNNVVPPLFLRIRRRAPDVFDSQRETIAGKSFVR